MIKPTMHEFLRRAANHKGPGILIGKRDRAISRQAIAAGFGRATEAWFPLFIINDRGRDALKLEAALQGRVADEHEHVK